MENKYLLKLDYFITNTNDYDVHLCNSFREKVLCKLYESSHFVYILTADDDM